MVDTKDSFKARLAQSGFTYLALLAAVAVISLMSTAVLQAGAALERRSSEQALLAIGREFRQALGSYASASKVNQLSAPLQLEDLLRDPREPGVLRHLRKIYIDPMTGQARWGLVRNKQDQSIMGVYSLAATVPIKQDGFDQIFLSFTAQSSYSDWVFTASAPDVIKTLGNISNSESLGSLHKHVRQKTNSN